MKKLFTILLTAAMLAVSPTMMASCSSTKTDDSFSYSSSYSSSSSSSSKKKDVRTYKVSNFDKLDTSAGVEVVYTVSSKQSVRIEMLPKFVDNMIVTCKGGTLTISRRSPSGRNNTMRRGDIVAYVSGPALKNIKVSSGASLTTRDAFNLSGTMTIAVSSGGDLTLPRVHCGPMSIDVSSGGDVTIRNAICGKTSIDVSSGADCDIAELTGTSLDIDCSSGADMSVKRANISGTTTVDVSSGADVNIGGKGTTVDFEASSGGSISAGNFTARNGRAATSSGGSVKCYVNNLTVVGKGSGIRNMAR